MSSGDRAAFVTVVEPNGAIEGQVLLLAESLRRWGGRLADAPIVCVSPRFHLPLGRRTLTRFEELGITYIDRNWRHRFSWYSLMNKAMALIEARRAVDAENLVWLDADMVVLDEPSAFLESDGDLAVMTTAGDIATAGPSDPTDAYWAAACDRLGIDLEALPWIEVDGRRVRYFVHTGAFRVRRLSPVIDHFLANIEALMELRVVPSTQGIYFHETLALALAPFTSGASRVELPRSHNFVLDGVSADGTVPGLDSARILHYQGWPYSERWPLVLSALGRCRPDRLAWLEERMAAIEPLRTPPLVRLLRKGLGAVRRRKAKRFLAGCRRIDNGAANDYILMGR